MPTTNPLQIRSKSNQWSSNLSRSDSLLETVGLEVTADGVRASTPSESWRENVQDCRRHDTETAAPKEVPTNGMESKIFIILQIPKLS